jgi:hypothetical protein
MPLTQFHTVQHERDRILDVGKIHCYFTGPQIRKDLQLLAFKKWQQLK